MERMMENPFINVKNRSFMIDAEIEVPAAGASGVILTQGGRFGGWSLYMKDGVPEFTYNFLGLERYVISTGKKLAPGKHKISFAFNYDGGGNGKGGDATIIVSDGSKGNGRIEKTQPNMFSADETADVGLDNQTPVAEGIGYGPEETTFTGKIDKIIIEIK